MIKDDRIQLKVINAREPSHISSYSDSCFGYRAISQCIKQVFPGASVSPSKLLMIIRFFKDFSGLLPHQIVGKCFSVEEKLCCLNDVRMKMHFILYQKAFSRYLPFLCPLNGTMFNRVCSSGCAPFLGSFQYIVIFQFLSQL